jgi:DNA mismatch repair protein MutL
VNRIRLLPEQVANQIAAGEVVERPASVVKELVENALDAEARRILVEIGAGGRSLIRVTDDGFGMSKDDALLCLERHATSKIQRAEDLASISSMGFRGEAVPSIASVSRFTLTTRERTDSSGAGTQVVINGGKILEVKAAASPAGTSIEVRQLFFNLPARRKFLRAEETERAHIQHYLTLAALAFPHVDFTFVSDGRTLWQLSGVSWTNIDERFTALRERLRQLHGNETPLLALDFRTEIEEAVQRTEYPEEPAPRTKVSFRLWGFIGAPGVSRSSRDEQYIFVNQRPVENRGLSFALVEGYHTSLMKGRYPVCCLFLEIDPAAVDVNIHPQKREVKFREEAAVRRLVAQALRDTLLRFHSGGVPPATPVSGAVAAKAETFKAALPISGLPTAQQEILSIEPSQELLPLPPAERKSSTAATLAPAASPSVSSDPTPSPQRALPTAQQLTAVFAPPMLAPRPASAKDPTGTFEGPVPLLHVPLRIVGVIGRLYVVLESDRGLVLLDQHAAHERVLFEQMLHRLESAEQAPAQRLLLPETLELSFKDAEFARRHLETLSRLGVVLREFGEKTFLLDALPPFVKATHPKRFATSLLDELKAAGAGVNLLRLGEDVVAKTVCRHAVKANDPLSEPELQQLVLDLKACRMPYTCPHGRPTLIEMSWRELEKRFGRSA